MAGDTTTNLDRINIFINWATSKRWDAASIKGALINSAAESHAWLETGDQYASSKYFDFAVYGGSSPLAGHDWYSQGASIDPSIGAYGFFQLLSTGFATSLNTWNGFFAHGNDAPNANAQLNWIFGSDGMGTGAGYGWMAGGDVSYTEAPGADSNVTFAQWAQNVNHETPAAQGAIFYADFERGGSGQYGNHTEANLDTLTNGWGVDYASSGSVTDNANGKTTPGVDTGTPKLPIGACLSVPNSGNQTTQPLAPSNPNGGGGSAGNTGQGIQPNGTIPTLDALVAGNIAVGCGSSGAYGQCYGLAQYWAVACGLSSMCLMVGGSPNASDIWSNYPWGSGSFAGFTAGAGSPPGGWQTGDIACMDTTGAYASQYGHVSIIGVVSGGIPQSTYEQNYAGKQYVIYLQRPWLNATTTGDGYPITGWIRPSQFHGTPPSYQ